MSFSLSQATIPVITQMLTSLRHVVDCASAHCTENKIDPHALLTARLFPNMWTFTKQVQAASTWGCNMAGRLAQVDVPQFADDEKSFDELKARLDRSLAFIGSVDTAAIDASVDRVITFTAGPNTRKLRGKDYLLHQSYPHFFFHCTTAYDILRTNGVNLAKRDYMGLPPGLIND
jgi:uncharacterized protein